MRARHALARLPGVMAVEPQRTVAVRVRSGYRERYLGLTGVPPDPRLKHIVDRDGRRIQMPASGVVMSQILASVLGVGTGDSVTLEVLEGGRPVRQVLVTGLVDDTMGLAMYMEIERAPSPDEGGRRRVRRAPADRSRAARRRCRGR